MWILKRVLHRYWKAKHVEYLQHQAREQEAVTTAVMRNDVGIKCPDGFVDAATPACAVSGAATEDASLPACDRLIAGYIRNDPTAAMSRVTGAHSDESELAMVREWCARLIEPVRCSGFDSRG
jgi:hypothetical protein